MKDEECLEEVTITVFPPIPGIGIIEEEPVVEDEDSCGDSSITQITPRITSSSEQVRMRISVNDPIVRINQLLEKAKEKYGERICIRVADYDNIDEAVEWLNAALRGSGQPAHLDNNAASAFIGTSAPIIAINNRLSFVGMIPNEAQFFSRLKASLRSE